MVDFNYNYTRISSESVPGFPTDPAAFANPGSLVPNVFANASINNKGDVNYEGFVGYSTNHLPPSTIYSGDSQGSPTPLINTSKYQLTDNTGKTYDSSIFFNSSSNDSGTTVFASSAYNFGTPEATGSGPSAIISVTNGSINTVAYQSTPFVTVPFNPNVSLDNPANDLATGSFVSAAGINNRGTITYIAGNSDGTSNLYAKNSSGAITTIASTTGNSNLSDFYLGGLDVDRGEGPFAKYTLPSINDKGAVAFNADLKGGGKGIFIGDGSSLNTVVAQTTQGPFSYLSAPSLNNNDTVAFNAGLTTGGGAILESTDGKLTTIADTSSSSIFKDFKSDVALNQQGDVAFLADLNDGSTAIYTKSALGLKKVISVGDSLDGSIVTSLFISHKGLNDDGQIAFDAVLANGGLEVFRAEPVAVPAPSSISFLAIGMICMICYRWRRHR